MSPALTLIFAATVGWTAPDERFVAVLTAHVQQVSDVAMPEIEEPAPTVVAIPYYYIRISTVPIPRTPILITYDRRLPIFRTKP